MFDPFTLSAWYCREINELEARWFIIAPRPYRQRLLERYMKAQAGICAEPNLHALYLMFNRTGDAAALTSRLASCQHSGRR
jgi:hypothetical protein